MGLIRSGVQISTVPAKETRPEIPHRCQPWYAAYMAALFEPDRKQIRERINCAEQLILARKRELGYGNDFTEQRALDNAVHALHALASCLNV